MPLAHYVLVEAAEVAVATACSTGQDCVWLLRHHLASTLLCQIFIRVWESWSRSSVQHGFQKQLSIFKHLRKLHPDHSISFFDLEFLAVTCEERKQSFE